MEATDLRKQFREETKKPFNTEWLVYNDYVYWLEQRLVKLLTMPTVSQQSEQLICPCCGSDKTYKTDAIHCNRCAVTTEI